MYQIEALNFLWWNEFSALWLDMGLGKTVTVWTLIRRLLAAGLTQRVLIVAPIRVAVQTWPTELGEWAHLQGTDYTLIRPTGEEIEVQGAKLIARMAALRLGLPRARAAQLAEIAGTRAEEQERRRLARSPAPVHIINRERIEWLVRLWGSRWPYDTVIWDEASGLRDHTSRRFKALAAVRRYITRLHELTATPRPESYEDLFPQIWLLDRGRRLGSNVTSYRDQYFKYDKYRYEWQIRPGAADEIIGRIADIVLDMKAVDYLDLQEPLMIDRPVRLTDEEMDRYRTLEATSVMEIADGEIVAETAGALFQKLLQFSSGAIYDGDRQVHHIHDHKLGEMEQIIEETMGKPMIVAYHYRPSLLRLKKRFPKAVVLSRDGREQHAWNRGEIPLMLLHPASAGHGLNLQYGGSLMAFFDVPASYENYDQTIHRLARQGQTDVVRVFHLWAYGTEDAHSVPRLRRKQADQDYMFARLRQLRQTIERRKVANGDGL